MSASHVVMSAGCLWTVIAMGQLTVCSLITTVPAIEVQRRTGHPPLRPAPADERLSSDVRGLD
jgi:hypothetical protein